MEKEKEYNEIFTCACVKLPMKYLGMPIDEKRLGKGHWSLPGRSLLINCMDGKARCFQ
jgi:hypothetical protein